MPQPSDRERLSRQRAFCDAYAKLGTISHAADLAGIARNTHYGWLHEQKDGERYAEMFAEAQQRYCDRLEREIDRRAVEGWEEPVHYKGERVDLVRKYSDNLLMFRTKAVMPERYRDNSAVQVSGTIGLSVSALDEVLKVARAAKAKE